MRRRAQTVEMCIRDRESSDGSSSIKRDVGEEMTMEQTLYGVMLESADVYKRQGIRKMLMRL